MANYKNMTKEALIALMEEKDQEINGQQEAIENLTQEVKAISAAGAGWLIETPNPAYNERTAGIQFAMGQAFIGVGQRVQSFELEPIKDTQLAKYSEAEQQAILERHNLSSAERAAKAMEAEFGYKVTFFDGSDNADEAMKKLVSNRSIEYRNALAMADAKEKAIQSTGVANFMGMGGK